MICDKKIIALCTSRVYDPQTHFFIEKLNERLKSHDIRILIYTINSDMYWKEDPRDDEAYVFDLIHYEVTDLVIIMDEKIKSRTCAEKIISGANSRSIPVMVVDGRYEGAASINFDYRAGFEKIVRHVIEDHKVRRPHMMAGIKGNAFSDERIEVFKKVIEENGIAFTPDMLSYGEFWANPARLAAQALIDRGDLPRAVICANDIMAINVCAVLAENGISVPSEVIVTGFDGYYETRFIKPRISTVNCMTDQLADAVADSAISVLLNHHTCEDTYVIPEPAFSQSCGCLPEQESVDSFREIISRFNDHFYRYQDDMKLYHEMMVRIQTGSSPESIGEEMRRMELGHMCFVADHACLDPEENYFNTEHPYFLSDDMRILYDSYAPGSENTPFRHRDIVPGLEKRLDSGMPLIFNVVTYMNCPLGYICWSFPDYEITDHAKASSISSTVNIGLGGYIIMQHQRFLSKRLADLYRNDMLTGLYNRTSFTLIFNRLKASEENEGKPLLIIMADLDGLKQINDTYGHDAGDEAISLGARALKESCPGDAICLRFGGDEMLAVILGDYKSEPIINKIEKFLSDYNKISEQPFKVVLSCGAYSTVLSKDMDFEAAVRCADRNMYARKNEHKSH